jgi:hypothetical protein
MAVLAPSEMSQQAWDYLLKFTQSHEWPVLHMYNNRSAEGQDQDVTCGIGFRLESPDHAAKEEIRRMFRNKKTGQPATETEMRQDWEIASKILRTGSNLESTGDGKGYADQCQLVMEEALMWQYMQTVMKRRYETELPKDTVWNFASLPWQAQIFALSYNYGRYLTASPKMLAALVNFDFDTAATESWLKGLSPRKLVAHRTLLWNAARIVEQRRDYKELPLGYDPPALLPWQPWSESILELDSDTTRVVSHTSEPTRPGTGK